MDFLAWTQDVIEQTRETLVDFVRIDLDVGFTLLQGASITRNAEHRASSVANARVALHSVRQFIPMINDQSIAAEHNVRAGELEQAIANFHPGATNDAVIGHYRDSSDSPPAA